MQPDCQERAYLVGEALAYLVKRMDTFCGISGADVVMYRDRSRSGLPIKMPASDVLAAQLRNYPNHRHLYPELHRDLLDGVAATAEAAVSGFLGALRT